MEQKYKVIAIYGKGGSGKDTILKKVLESKKFNLNKIVGITTRPPREGEKDGVEYYFISLDDFATKIISEELVEATTFRGWYYGTSISAFSKDKINIGIFNDKALDVLLQDNRFEIVPVYIEVAAKNRLIRMLNREDDPDIDEIIRRYKADEKDFEEFFVEHEELPIIIYLNNKPLDENALIAYFDSLIAQFDFWANPNKLN